jgi:hypothetical protein
MRPVGRFLFLLLAMALVACGGGTKESVIESATTTRTLSVSLSMLDGSGQAIADLGESQSVTVTAQVQVRSVTMTGGRVTSDTVAPASGATVTFAATGGNLHPASGQVLTDASGLASVTLTAGGVLGAFKVSATASAPGTQEASAELSWQVVRVDEPRLVVLFVDDDGYPVSRLEAGRAVWAQAAISIEQVTKAAVNDVIVSFAATGGTFEPSSATALTNADGIARVRFTPSIEQGAYILTATAQVGGEDVSADYAYEVIRSNLPRIRVWV